jgi:minor extracellular serine protease Vpr
MKNAIGLFLLASAAFGQGRGPLADYALILEDAPIAQKTHSRVALQSRESQAEATRLRGVQARVLSELKRRGIVVEGADQILVNAVFVAATRETAMQLRDIPGVAHVAPVPRFHRDLDRALTLENVPAAWSALGGASNAGAGIKIGIIDSGIDQSHPGFQDASLTAPSGFPKGDANFTNNKVIVARSYVSMLSIADPRYDTPDDLTPRDRVGHGTAIAMIAAGAQNTGPAGTIQGVAPKAFLGNYKVYGSPGVNDFTLFSALNQALNDALADGMDVVTLSLGGGDSPFYGPLDLANECADSGGNTQCDVRAQAVENAIRNGMVVVVSAGNDGNINNGAPTLNTIHTPGTAPNAITVGASVNSHVLYQAVHVNGSGVPSSLQNIRALFSDGPHKDPFGIASGAPAPIKDVAQTGNDGLACSSLPSGALAGAIALIQRGTCNFSDKIINAQNAGAIGVIIYQTSGQNTIFSGLLAQDTGIPSVMIGNTDGVALKSFLASNSNATGALDPALTASENPPNAVWAASSRGPSTGTFSPTAPTTAIKPELVAVGVNLYTATQKFDPNGEAYNASGYTTVTGTSYAVPMAAGAVALVKQKNPSFTPAQLKSAVVNTATQDVSDEAGAQARVNSAGAGKLSAGDAVTATATLEPATMEFGVIAAGALPINRTLKITNAGSASATFTFAVQQRDADSNARVAVTPASVTLAAGQQNSVTVSLTGTRPSPGSYEGFIVVTGSGPTLRVPYQYLVGSGVPFVAYPINNGGFLGGAGDQGWELDLRVTDQYGVPVIGTPLVFTLPPGTSFTKNSSGGNLVDGATTNYGNAAALVNLPPTQGDLIFTAAVGGLNVEFDGFSRVYPAITLNRVVDAATGVVGQGLAPGSYISIYGTALADATQVESTASLPISLSTVNVTFDGGGLSLPVHLHFVSPGQINVQIPWEFQGQSSVVMKTTVNGYLSSDVYTVPLAQVSPGIFEFSDNGRKSAVVQDTGFNLITQANPAQRGKAIQIYMNGLGPVSNQPASGEPSPGASGLASTNATPTVSIGGVPAQVVFSGMTPGAVGLYQVNAVVPSNAPTGNQSLVVAIGGKNSQTSSIAVQ